MDCNIADLDDEGIEARLGAAGKQSEFERLKQDNIDTIVSYGDNFMGLVCRDACDGHDVGRVSARHMDNVNVWRRRFGGHMWCLLSLGGY